MVKTFDTFLAFFDNIVETMPMVPLPYYAIISIAIYIDPS